MKKFFSLVLAVLISMSYCVSAFAVDSDQIVSFESAQEAANDFSNIQVESFNEYDYIDILQRSTPKKLEELGISVQEAASVVSEFENALLERALLSDSELRGYGYDDSEIGLFRAYSNGQMLSSAQLRSLGSTCSATITRSSVSLKSATFSYTYTWNRCPIVTLSDSAAMKWIAYDNAGGTIGVEQTSYSMTIDYYHMDKNTSGSSSTPVFLGIGTNEPNLDFDVLNMQFPVYRTFTASNGISSDCYAKTGTVQVSVRVPSGNNQSIHHIFVGGLYGHTLAGIGSPNVSVGKGSINIGFSGNASVDSIASRKATIYYASTNVEYWAS